jgi:hypothetical protein
MTAVQMLRQIGQWHRRKLRLVAAACCRRVWDLLEEDSRNAVLAAEQVAEGRGQKESPKARETLAAAQARAEAVVKRLKKAKGADAARTAAATAAVEATRSDAGYGAMFAARSAATARARNNGEQLTAEEKVQLDLLVDIHGNPLRPVVLQPGWRTDQVVSLARSAYAERALPGGELDVAHLAVLADALVDAGCDNWDILSHLREPGPHVRGCWVVDLLLEKG